jgi:protein-disulfide isomerase
MKAFNVCMASGKFAAQVERDMQDGSIVGVTGTPATFVNGRLVSGAISVERLTAMIDEELARKSR